MHLTAEEEKIFDGEYGWASQVSMQILTRLGDLFGATKLIPISSAHLSGVSYKTIGDAPIEFLEELAKTTAKTLVDTTLNPACYDPDYPIKPSDERREKQRHIIDLYKDMGAAPTLTCTPYYSRPPQRGTYLSWAESSAVIYANSVLDAYTNREGSPSALAAALIGKTPDYGLHKPENREPTVQVNVEAELRNEAEFGALGIYLGKLLDDKIPLLKDISTVNYDNLKHLGAAMATAGMTSMFKIDNPTMTAPLEKVTVERKAIENTFQSLSIAPEQPDLVFLGCPHCSLDEIRAIANLLKGRKVRGSLKLWVCTSRWLKENAKDQVNVIEKAGGHVICDTCAIVTWLQDLEVDSLMTNSAKTAYYAPTMNKVPTTFASSSKCLETACH